MFGRRLGIIVWLCLSLSLVGRVGHAQQQGDDRLEADGQDSTEVFGPEKGATAPGINFLDPDTYFLPDKQGNLRAILGFSYEDFFRAWQNRALGPQATPAFVLEQLGARIEPATQIAGNALSLTLDIRVRILQEGAQSIPVGLPAATLQALSAEAEATVGFVHYDSARAQHVWEVPAGEARTVKATFKFYVPIQRQADQQSLRLRLPRATTSRMDIVVEEGATDFSFEGEGILEDTSTEGDRTRTVLGPRGDISVQWRRPSAAEPTRIAPLTATTDMVVNAQGNDVSLTSLVTVRRLTGDLHDVAILIPQSQYLVEVTGDEVEIVAPHTSSAQEESADRTIHVRAQSVSSSVVAVRIVTTTKFSGDDSYRRADLRGPRVEGVVRHTGRVQVEESTRWNWIWRPGNHIRQIAVASEGTGEQNVVAEFEFDQDDWALQLEGAASPADRTCVPDYQLEVRPDSLILEAEYQYPESGQTTFAIRMDPSQWQLEDARLRSRTGEPLDAVVEHSDLLFIKLPDTVSESFTLYTRFRRVAVLDDGRFECRLPFPEGVRFSEGRLRLSAPASWSVQVLTDKLVGLEVDAQETPGDLAESAEATSFRCHSPPFKLVGDLSRKPPELTSRIGVVVEPLGERFLVRESLALEVKNSELRRVELVGLTDQIAEGEIIARLNGVVQSVRLPAEDDRFGSLRPGIIVALDQSLVGEAELEIEYLISPGDDSGASLLRIPLLVPNLGGHENIEIDLPYTLAKQWQLVQRQGDIWRKDTSASKGLQRYSTSEHVSSIDFSKEPADLASSALFVDRAWVQAWLSGKLLQTRAAYRIRQLPESLTVHLPDGVDSLQEVLLQGIPAELESDDQSSIVVRVPVGLVGKSATLEIVLRTDATQDHLLDCRPPRFVSSTHFGRVYWQVVLPRNLQWWSNPAPWISESPWQWTRGYWSRQPTHNTGDLAVWAGCSEVPSVPSGVNTYLLSGFERNDEMQLVMKKRSTLLMICSAILFCSCLMPLYIASKRLRGLVIVVPICGIILAIVAWPLAPLVLQAGALGVVLSCVGFGLRQFLLARDDAWPAQQSLSTRTVAPSGSGLRLRRTEPEVSSSVQTAVQSGGSVG